MKGYLGCYVDNKFVVCPDNAYIEKYGMFSCCEYDYKSSTCELLCKDCKDCKLGFIIEG